MILFHLTIANLKLVLRNRQALFWAVLFPLIFVIVFGIFFGRGDPFSGNGPASVAVIDKARDDLSARLIESLSAQDGLSVELRDDEAAARQDIQDGNLNLLLIFPEGLSGAAYDSPPAQVTAVFDETNIAGRIAVGTARSFVDGSNLQLAQAPTRIALSVESIAGDDLGYFDVLLPGLAVWGVMNFSILGLATTIATYREKRILVRIQVTPLPVSLFFSSQVLAYMFLPLAQAAIMLITGVLLFGASIQGSLPQFALLVIIGNCVFVSLGFIVGAFSRTVAAASGLGNAVALPLMFLSGVFFPLDTLPAIIRIVVEYLPLAPLLEVVRGVTLYSKSFWEFPIELATIGAWIVASAVVATKTFRFR